MEEIEQMLRIRDVLKKVPVSRSLWYRLVAEGVAPASIKFSARTAMWRAADINEFLRSRGVKI